jgi:hypothetical protein
MLFVVKFVLQPPCLDMSSIQHNKVPNPEFWGILAFEVSILLHSFLSCLQVPCNYSLHQNDVVDVSVLGIIIPYPGAWIGATQVSAIVGKEG